MFCSSLLSNTHVGALGFGGQGGGYASGGGGGYGGEFLRVFLQGDMD